MKTSTLTSDALLLLTAAIWGFAFVAQRVGMDYVGPFTYNGVRFALGCLSLAPLLPGSRHAAVGTVLPPAGRRLFLVGGGALGIVLFIAASLQQVALLTTTAGNAGFITGLYVVIVPLCGLFWGRRPGGSTIVGALLAAVGLYFLSVTESVEMEFGDGLVLVSAFFWAAQVLLVAWLSPRVNPVRLAFLPVCGVLAPEPCCGLLLRGCFLERHPCGRPADPVRRGPLGGGGLHAAGGGPARRPSGARLDPDEP